MGEQALRGSQQPHLPQAPPAQDAVDAVRESKGGGTFALGLSGLPPPGHWLSCWVVPGLREAGRWLPLSGAGGMDGCVLRAGLEWLVIMDIIAISVPLCLPLDHGCRLPPCLRPEFTPSRRSGQAVTSVVAAGAGLWCLSPPRAERRPLIGSRQGRAARGSALPAKPGLDSGEAGGEEGRQQAHAPEPILFYFCFQLATF